MALVNIHAAVGIVDEVMYMGAPLTLEVGVIYGDKALVEGTDFGISY